ncbi:hypothetical protein [Leptospira perolatii]|uniref:hypothetical protein n=1 Tax=Leptospira perolatii TaxID=2023191 RepID=UPI000F6415E5|nr:hypothetical protein [Leptospira perolatii]
MLSLFLFPIFLGIGWYITESPLNDLDFQSIGHPEETKTLSVGFNRKGGNVLLVQPEFHPEYYSREDRFEAWIESFLRLAKGKGWIEKSTLVVYPPEIGNYFFLHDQRREVFFSPNEIEAWEKVSFYRSISWRELSNGSFTKVQVEHSIAKEMFDTYVRIFSNLSRLYNAFIIGGSILLPPLEIQGTEIKLSEGKWEEKVFLFKPDGTFSLVQIKKDNYRSNSLGEYLNQGVSRNVSPVTEKLGIVQFPFARFGFLFKEDFKDPSLSEAIRKTFVSRWIALGSVQDDGLFQDWAKQSNLETTAQVIFSGTGFKTDFPGNSFVKSRYGVPEPKPEAKGPYLINLYL